MKKKEITKENIEIGQRVKALRREHNLSQEKMASILGIESVPFYQNIEKGENDLQIDRCIKLSKYFDVSTDYILKGEVSDCREFQLYYESLSGREKKREFDILLNKTFSK